MIAEGEVLQLVAAADLATTEETYLQVIRGKTAALFSAAAEAGGVVGGASREEVSALFAYGDALGISFQITDDLLDYGGITARLGKNTGDDFRERKMSLPVIRAVAKADAAERQFWERVIVRNDQRAGDLEHAISLMSRHDSLEETRTAALLHSVRAKEALKALPSGQMRDMLDALADFVVERIT